MGFLRKLFGGPKKPATETSQPPGDYDYELIESEFDNGRGLVVLRLSDGQRLNWRSLPRSHGLESINVVGEQHYLTDLQNKAFAHGQSILIKPEPDNQYDPNAIAVYDADGKHQIGYLPKEDCKRLLNKMKKKRFACISMWETWEGKKRVGLRLLLIEEEALPRIKGMKVL